MAIYRDIATCRAALADSQVRFRLHLARQRAAAYPLDSMDFIMMDLERPEGRHRHAHWCTGDLTGRLLEFLSYAEGIDGRSDARLPELFERILQQRRPSGLFGKYVQTRQQPRPFEEETSYGPRLFTGLIRYYELIGDARALEAAEGIGRFNISRQEQMQQALGSAGRLGFNWNTEPMALLYAHTGKREYLDHVALIRDGLGDLDAPDNAVHAHMYLSTLRGLQTAALVSGDRSWSAKAEKNRQLIIERHYEMPDGCTPEGFPHSMANEGCSIADWLMLNLNAGLLGDDSAYAKAEHILWNALAFNQWITGSWGHRALSANGYGMRRFEEAWWCCLHDGGLALAECARQTVTFRDSAVRVNLLIPGTFRLTLPGGGEVEVRIDTRYPATAATTVEVLNAPADMPIRLRVPACIRRAQVTQSRDGAALVLHLEGRIGHYVQPAPGGMMLMYGPLVLAPSIYHWMAEPRSAGDATVPAGYIPEVMPEGLPSLELPGADADGLLGLGDQPLPDWTYFDEGGGAACWVEGSAANVPVRFPDGRSKTLRFTPLCYNTSNLTLCETPIVFHGGLVV